MENFEEFKEEVNRLKALCDDSRFGLATWRMFMDFRLKRLNELSGDKKEVMKEEFSIEIQLAILELAIKSLGKVYDDFSSPADYTNVLKIVYNEITKILKGEEDGLT